MDMCNNCSNEFAKKKCSICLVARYCDRQCQTKAWKQHKLHCIPATGPKRIKRAGNLADKVERVFTQGSASDPHVHDVVFTLSDGRTVSVTSGVEVPFPLSALPPSFIITFAAHELLPFIKERNEIVFVQTTIGELVNQTTDYMEMDMTALSCMMDSVFACLLKVMKSIERISKARLKGSPEATKKWVEFMNDLSIFIDVRRALGYSDWCLTGKLEGAGSKFIMQLPTITLPARRQVEIAWFRSQVCAEAHKRPAWVGELGW